MRKTSAEKNTVKKAVKKNGLGKKRGSRPLTSKQIKKMLPPRFAKILNSNKSIEKLSESLLESLQLDQKILDTAAAPYNLILKKISVGKKRLNAERKLALTLGNRILEKAKEVRDQLVEQAHKAQTKYQTKSGTRTPATSPLKKKAARKKN